MFCFCILSFFYVGIYVGVGRRWGKINLSTIHIWFVKWSVCLLSCISLFLIKLCKIEIASFSTCSFLPLCESSVLSLLWHFLNHIHYVTSYFFSAYPSLLLSTSSFDYLSSFFPSFHLLYSYLLAVSFIPLLWPFLVSRPLQLPSPVSHLLLSPFHCCCSLLSSFTLTIFFSLSSAFFALSSFSLSPSFGKGDLLHGQFLVFHTILHRSASRSRHIFIVSQD